MSKIIAFVLLLVFGAEMLPAQSLVRDTSFAQTFRQRRSVGLNMTPLLTQLVPFNRSDPRNAGPFLLRFKWNNTARTTAFRMSMGFNLTLDAFDNETPQLNFAIGFEKRRSISQRWSYTRGLDLVFLAGDSGIPGNESEEFGGIGLGPVFGIEYAIAPRITLGTEGMLAIGLPLLIVIPPVGVFLNYHL